MSRVYYYVYIIMRVRGFAFNINNENLARHRPTAKLYTAKTKTSLILKLEKNDVGDQLEF